MSLGNKSWWVHNKQVRRKRTHLVAHAVIMRTVLLWRVKEKETVNDERERLQTERTGQRRTRTRAEGLALCFALFVAPSWALRTDLDALVLGPQIGEAL